jgi:bifunctional non-homologous end joining protein LigD
MTKKQQVKIDGRDLILTNAEKVYFPRNGFTKGEVIKFYSEIADTILPHLRGRPLTLKRYPDGITGEPFYEKNARHAPPWVETFKVPRSEGGGDINYILCNDRATLLWTTNLGDIEKHMLLAKAPELNRPTSVVFDLDPGEGVTILDCGKVALHLRDVFNALKLDSFVKVSGSKGLHLSVPLNTEVTYEMSQPFAKTIAELAEQQLPKQVVSAMAKTLRRGKVLIDWSQNSDFKTTVCVYAMRAKEGGPFISMPVAWEELAKAVKTKKPEALFFKPGDFAVDGEIVALDAHGRPAFQLLQNSQSAKPPIFFYAFDLLNFEGEELLRTPIEQRREKLSELFMTPTDPLRLSPLLQAPAGEVLEAVQKLGLEGVVGKRIGSIYEPGERSGAWIKRRTNREQEFVIGGYVPGARGFDTLIVGVYEKKRLIYVAKVKDGFVPRTRDEIFPQLKKLPQKDCPFTNLPETKASRWGEALTAEKMMDCRWVKPELVCQVAFVEWTDGNKLRHCTFRAMRDDKNPKTVVRET